MLEKKHERLLPARQFAWRVAMEIERAPKKTENNN